MLVVTVFEDDCVDWCLGACVASLIFDIRHHFLLSTLIFMQWNFRESVERIS